GTDEYLVSDRFSPRERAAVLWAEHVAKNTAGERTDVFEEVKSHFAAAELVELTAICGRFAMSNRLHDSLCLPIEAHGEVDKIRRTVRNDPARIKAFVEHLIDHWPSEFPSSCADPIATERAAGLVSNWPQVDHTSNTDTCPRI